MASSVFIGYFGGGAPWLWNGTTASLTGNLSVSGVILASDGSASAPSYSFASETGLGWYRATTGTVAMGNPNVSGTIPYAFAPTQFVLGSAESVNWSSTTLATGSTDVSLSRGAANRLTLAVGDAFNLAPTAFASLPAGAEGNLACVTDSNTATWGATIAGGGANNVLAFHNGTNWTVAAA